MEVSARELKTLVEEHRMAFLLVLAEVRIGDEAFAGKVMRRCFVEGGCRFAVAW
jgi:hypothetical protein